MAHAIWIQERISQMEELLDLKVEFEKIAKIIRDDGLMIIRDNQDVTEEWVFDQCVLIMAKRIEGKYEQEEQA